MVEIGKGHLKAKFIYSLYKREGNLESLLPKDTLESLADGWDIDKPAKIYVGVGRTTEIIDGSHRASFFARTNRSDYMVPVVFYTDD